MQNKKRRKRKFQTSHMRRNHPRYKFEKEYEEGKQWALEQNKKDYYIVSVDGLMLHAAYLPAKENPRRIVLLCHGYQGTSYGDFAAISRYLHENGCSLLFIDQRCCGESEGKYITFGAMEQRDIVQWSYFAARKNKKRLPIYLYGESLGAASVLMALGHRLPPDIKGAIADCGFASMRRQMKDMALNWYRLSNTDRIWSRMDFYCRLFAGYCMDDADTTLAMKKNKRPVLFFHGGRDTFVDPKNSKYNYKICRAKKELVIIPSARHLCCAYEQPELYRKKLMKFFEAAEN